VIFDPLFAQGEVELQLAELAKLDPRLVLLTNRHHYRSADALASRFGTPVRCHVDGLHEFTEAQGVEGFRPKPDGSELHPEVIAHQVGVLCPDEVAYQLPAVGALVVGDAVVRGEGKGQPIGFVPDQLMDDPPATKEGLLARFAELLDAVAFNHLLLAHGGPVVGDGAAALRELVAVGGRTAFEL